MLSLRNLFILCLVFLISCVVPSSVRRRRCPPGEVWMDCGGCDNTCECPSKNCDPGECRPGCFCDSNAPFTVRQNSTCVSIWNCDKLRYQCCPPCDSNERCILTSRACLKPPCPPPLASCRRNH